MEMAMYYGEDEGGEENVDQTSPGGLVVEALQNIRTIASLSLEDYRSKLYKEALDKQDLHKVKENLTKGMYHDEMHVGWHFCYCLLAYLLTCLLAYILVCLLTCLLTDTDSICSGGSAGLGQFVQMWGMALMFYFGGWLLQRYPDKYSFRDYLISMFSLFFSLYGLAIASQGLANRDKAKLAAQRIFDLIDRKSMIDPLSIEGKRGT
jgi:ABC-type multidrug transport system fused ATPase/permease subunit